MSCKWEPSKTRERLESYTDAPIQTNASICAEGILVSEYQFFLVSFADARQALVAECQANESLQRILA
jgi:hypothetical protein